jgi:hypothetical protein
MKEALIGNQHKIDANHNGKVDAQDFKILKGKFKKFSKKKMNEALEKETVKHPIGQRPKGPGWVLKQSGEQTGKDHNVWERKFKRVGNVNEAEEMSADSARVGGKYSMEEERLENLFNSLSEENQEKFAAMLETEEGLDELLDFAEKQGF